MPFPGSVLAPSVNLKESSRAKPDEQRGQSLRFLDPCREVRKTRRLNDRYRSVQLMDGEQVAEAEQVAADVGTGNPSFDHIDLETFPAKEGQASARGCHS